MDLVESQVAVLVAAVPVPQSQMTKERVDSNYQVLDFLAKVRFQMPLFLEMEVSKETLMVKPMLVLKFQNQMHQVEALVGLAWEEVLR